MNSWSGAWYKLGKWLHIRPYRCQAPLLLLITDLHTSGATRLRREEPFC